MSLLPTTLTITAVPGRHSGIRDVEALVRKALGDWLTNHNSRLDDNAYHASLNGTRHEDCVKDLIATVLVDLEPKYDPALTNGALSLTSFVYRALRQRYIIQWYRDNIRDTRSGRPCPECGGGSKQHTRWIGNDQRQCIRCGLVYDDYTEEPFEHLEHDQPTSPDLTRCHVRAFATSKRLSPRARDYMREVVLKNGDVNTDLKVETRDFAKQHGLTPNDLFRVQTELREQLLVQGHAA